MANSEDPDQMPHSAVSDLGQHCLSQYLGFYGIQDATQEKVSMTYEILKGKGSPVSINSGNRIYHVINGDPGLVQDITTNRTQLMINVPTLLASVN